MAFFCLCLFRDNYLVADKNCFCLVGLLYNLPLNESVAYSMYIVSIYDSNTGNMISKKVEANY